MTRHESDGLCRKRKPPKRREEELGNESPAKMAGLIGFIRYSHAFAREQILHHRDGPSSPVPRLVRTWNGVEDHTAPRGALFRVNTTRRIDRLLTRRTIYEIFEWRARNGEK